MYDKKYEHPFFMINDVKSDVITMSGTGYDDGRDNVFGGDTLGGVQW